MSTSTVTAATDIASNRSLRQSVEQAMQRYFDDLGDDHLTHNLYELVLSEVEAPLLEAVLKHTAGNQSEAATMLGLNRGTLRKKMKQYGLFK
ncbi:MAG: DNA-binding transcriptional regulator Fis [Pseudohongiella sp.]|nr:DNA-binding transcriptional regulator Fis [Pseudohongiella sp.]MDP2379616.1 DNA-binding transcriptional regulator Fis [Pseudohongiella sp.]